MPDERDLADRQRVAESLVPMMDKLEAKEREVRSAAWTLELAAEADVKAGNWDHAIELLHACIQLHVAADVMPYRIPEYEKRIRQIKRQRRSAPGR